MIEEQFGVRYHAGHVWKILGELGWSPRRPVGRARERNEQAIRSWKKKTWTAIKRKPSRKGARSSSSTKADGASARTAAAPGRRGGRRQY